MINLYGGLLLYALAGGFAAWALRSGDRRGLQTARFGALCGAIDHIVFLVRLGAKTGHFPVTGAIEAYIFLSTAIILLALALDWLRHWTALVVATLPLAVTTTLLALSGRPTFKGRRTALASVAGFFLVMTTFWASVFWSDFHRFH